MPRGLKAISIPPDTRFNRPLMLRFAPSRKLGLAFITALRSPDRGWAISKARTIAAYVLVRRLGYRLSDVAAYFGRDMATLATLLARLSDRVQANDTARREIERLNEIVES